MTQNEYGWAAMAKPTAWISAAMSSSSKSGTTRSVSPFAAMPPANVTWPPPVTAPAEPSALSTSTASSGRRAIASRSVSTAVLSGSPSSRSSSCSRYNWRDERPIVISSIQPAPVSEVSQNRRIRLRWPTRGTPPITTRATELSLALTSWSNGSPSRPSRTMTSASLPASIEPTRWSHLSAVAG